MSDLVEFLTAQYDRIEEKARAASVRAATWDVRGTWHLEGVEHNVVGEEEAFCHPHNVEHLARHDPAHVLADIESKRRILSLHRSESEGGPDPICNVCLYTPPCETVRALAAPFSGEPGYREDWTR